MLFLDRLHLLVKEVLLSHVTVLRHHNTNIAEELRRCIRQSSALKKEVNVSRDHHRVSVGESDWGTLSLHLLNVFGPL